MRFFGFGITVIALTAAVSTAEAKSLSKKEVEMCRWGSDIARSAQQSKLSGTTLWSSRKKLQNRNFSEPWMKNMALGITDQTYSSKSHLKPVSVKQTYYEGCIHHELTRRSIAKK